MTEPVLWSLDDHTRAKHRVLSAYLKAWLPVMGQQTLKLRSRDEPPRLLLVDGFCGPGRYETGEDGSPLIMLKTLLEHDAFERMGEVEFLFLFIEHDRRRVEHLEGELTAIEVPDNVKVMVEHGEFETTFGEMVEDVHSKQGRTLVPTFAFIDPFGYTRAPMSLAGRFLTFERCEALIFLPFSFIVRFVGREGQDQAMNSLFGSERWREAIQMEGDERGAFLLGLFEEQLGSQGKVEHVRSFALRTADGNDYRLVFASQHDKGLELIKDAMWSVDPVEGTRYIATRTDDGQEVLFTPETDALDTAPLLAHLRGKFGTDWFTIEQAQRAALLETPFRVSSHLKARTLAPAEKAAVIEVDRSNGQRRFAAGVRMRFCDC
ncbi:MAG TPA: three-Cys-motif partner protein TcmP [Solirubrobacterales bacterium]|nr:three-Cys-motif partner protein TcmP [Solirubrobacterales bacterium]